MRRREFIALFGGATAASAVRPTATGAQTPPKIPRIGYIAGSSTTGVGHIVGAFRNELRKLGYVEGQTIRLEVRYAEGRLEDADLHSAAGFSPYSGLDLKGRVRTTVSRGRVVYDQGRVVGKAGWGRFVERMPYDPARLG